MKKGKSASGTLAILMVISMLSIMSFQATPVGANPDGPPTIENALAIPDTIAIVSYTNGMSTGPWLTYLTVEVSGEGEINVILDLRPLFEQMFANVEKDEEAWQELLDEMGDAYMSPCCDGVWCYDFYSTDPVEWLLDFGVVEEELDVINRILSQEIQLGEFTIPVTVTVNGEDTYENIDNIELAIVDIMVPLEEGWNLRSTPVALANGRWGDIKSLGGGLSVDVALRIDDGNWEIVDDDYELRPLEAIYIHATERDQMGLIFSRDVIMGLPTRQLDEGWNLVGYAPPCEILWWPEGYDSDWSYLEWDEMYVRQVMESIEETLEGHRGYTVVISPSEDLSYWEEFQYKDCEPFDIYNPVNGYCDGYFGGYFKGWYYDYYYDDYWYSSIDGYVYGSLDGYFSGDYDGYFEGYFSGYFEGYFYGLLGDDFHEGRYEGNYDGFVCGYVEECYIDGYLVMSYGKYFEQESWVYTARPWEYDVQWYESSDMAHVDGYWDCGDFYGYFEGLFDGYYYDDDYYGYICGDVNGSLEGYVEDGYYNGYFEGYFSGWFYGWLGDEYYHGDYDGYYDGYVSGYIEEGYIGGYGEHWEYLYDYYMQPFCGYKVFMENPDPLAGFNETPLQWSIIEYYYYD